MGNLLRVAILEDEPDLRFLLSSYLAGKGCTVQCYNSVAEYRLHAPKFGPQWAIIDNNLPDGSGWEMAHMLRKDANAPRLILISANPDSPRIPERENVHYLFKPLGFSSIASLISA